MPSAEMFLVASLTPNHIFGIGSDGFYIGGKWPPDSREECILFQFTGLADTTGADIYEGDIIKWDDCSGGKYWRFAVVKIDPDIQFDCAPIGEVGGIKNSSHGVFHYGVFAYKDTHEHLTIIGNVRENPELING